MEHNTLKSKHSELWNDNFDLHQPRWDQSLLF